MDISAPVIINHIIEKNGVTCKLSLRDIGAWNMDTTASKLVAGIAHPSYLIGLQVIIIADDPNVIRDFIVPTSTFVNEGYWYTIGIHLYLVRRTGGFYDHVDYNGGGNRGRVLIWYYE